jgi:hypothetical protein
LDLGRTDRARWAKVQNSGSPPWDGRSAEISADPRSNQAERGPLAPFAPADIRYFIEDPRLLSLLFRRSSRGSEPPKSDCTAFVFNSRKLARDTAEDTWLRHD